MANLLNLRDDLEKFLRSAGNSFGSSVRQIAGNVAPKIDNFMVNQGLLYPREVRGNVQKIMQSAPPTFKAPPIVGPYLQNRVFQPLGEANKLLTSAFQPKPFINKVGDVAGAGLNLLGAGVNLTPVGPAFNLYEGSKARMASPDQSLRGQIQAFKKGFTGETQTGLGTALGRGSGAEDVVNLAEAPLMLLASRRMAKTPAISKVDLKEVEYAWKNAQMWDRMSPAGQIRNIDELTKWATKYIPEVVKNKEMRKLSVHNPEQWRNTIVKFLEDKIVQTYRPEPSVGLGVRTLKRMEQLPLGQTNKPLQTRGGTGGLKEDILSNAGREKIGPLSKEMADIKISNDFELYDRLPKEPPGSRKTVKYFSANPGPSDMILRTEKGMFQRNNQTIYEKVPIKVLAENVAGGRRYKVVDKTGDVLDTYDGQLPKEEIIKILKSKGATFIKEPISTPPPLNQGVNIPNVTGKIATPKTLVPQQVQLPATIQEEIVSQPQLVTPLPTGLQKTQIPVQTGIQQVQGKTGGIVNNPQEWAYGIKDRLYTEYVDRFNPLSKLANIAGKSKELRGRLAQYYGTGSTADYHLQGELSPILKGADVDDLRTASIAMRDIELASRKIQGSPIQTKAQDVLNNLKTKYGDEGMKNLGEKLQQLYAYQDRIAKQYLVDTGIMSPDAYAKMRADNSFYVPFKRVMDEVDSFLGIPVKRGAGSVGSQNVIFRIKGSDKDIIDPIESIVENTYKMVSLGQRQQVARAIAGLSRELPELVKKTNVADARNTITLFENGRKVHYSVPEEVADAARGMSEESLVTLTKILKVPTDIFRTATTGINPEFLLPNVSRDVQSALFNAGLNPLKWVAGLAHYAGKDQVYKEFLQAGARTARVSLNRPYVKQTAQELAGKGFRVNSPADIIRGAEMLSQYSEQPTRVAVFKDALQKAIQSGMSKEEALREAAYWAQEGTVNFARRGSKMANINAVYAYLNARMQGIDRMFRTARQEPGKAALRFGLGLLAPALSLYAWNSQNPKYYDERIVSKRDKQDNFIFMLPQTIGGVDYIKLPKAEVAKVVNPVEEFFDFSRGKGGDVLASVGNVLKSFSPIDNWGGIIPTAIAPLVETAINKDFYYGKDIVPDYKKNYPAQYQDSPYTSPLFRMVGQKLGMSPALIQNLAESYGGGLVRVAELGSQPFIPDKYKGAKNEQGAGINRAPVLRRFLGGEKRTIEEQARADVSKQKAIEFDVNDIKSGINRGDIPIEEGVKKIQELRGQSTQIIGDPNTNGGYDLGSSVMFRDSTTGKWKEAQKSDIEKANTDAEYSLTSDRLKRSGDWNGWISTTQEYIKALENYQSKLDPSFEKADITRIQNKIEDLKAQVDKYKSYGGFAKQKTIKKTIKIKKPKKVTMRKVTVPKTKISVSKLPSIKIKAPPKIRFKSGNRRFTIKA
jgi:hypothetical protein